MPCSFNNLSQPAALRPADVQNVARSNFRDFRDSYHGDLARTDTFSRDRGIENRSEWILPEHTQFKRVSAGAVIDRPLDKLAKVEEVSSFYLRLSRVHLLSKRSCRNAQQYGKPRR